MLMLQAMAALVALAAVARGDAAPDDAARFDAAFGQRIRDVKATRETADDAALAAELLKLAEQVADDAALVERFALASYELVQRVPEAYPTAVAAMRMRSGALPETAADSQAKVVDVLQTAYARLRDREKAAAGAALVEALRHRAEHALAAGEADAAMESIRRAIAIARNVDPSAVPPLQERLQQMAELARVHRDVETVKNRLKADPTNKALAQELVMLYIAKLDAPAEAGKFGFLLEGELGERVKRAGRPVAELTQAELLDTGEWYAGLSDAERGAAQAALAARAVGYLEPYLASGPDDRLMQLRVGERLKVMRQRAGGAAATGEWVNLLAEPDTLKGIEEIAVQGAFGGSAKVSEVRYAGGALSIGWRTMMASDNEIGDVFVQADAEVTEPPQDGKHFWLVHARRTDAGNYEAVFASTGVLTIARRFPDQLESVPLATIVLPELKGRINVGLIVVGGTLVAQVNGQEVLRAQDPKPLPPGRVGVGTYRAKVTFRNLRYRAATAGDAATKLQ